MTIEMLVASSLLLSTLSEVLEIEWSKLTEDMQIAELRAASRSLLVQAAAMAEVPVIIPLADEEISTRSASSALGRASAKKWKDFVSWWAPAETDGRSQVVGGVIYQKNANFK